MTEADYGTFESAFRRFSSAFRVKVKPTEMDELTRLYFKLLTAAPIDAVLQAGRRLLETSRTFPKPAEWLAAVSALSPAAAAGADVRVMSDEEAREYTRAEGLRYQDEPCFCLLCQSAGVTHRFLRFVPDVGTDGSLERAWHPGKRQLVIAGHWAHGDELRRWYDARDHFQALVPRRYSRALVTT
jgi:hypothetical protein